jgi:hypothetical protein
MFVKGVSGNPKGRPKQYAEVVALCRGKTKENIAGMIALAKGAEDQNVQLRARQYIHEIAWGKPAANIVAEVNHNASDTLLNLLERIATSDAGHS